MNRIAVLAAMAAVVQAQEFEVATIKPAGAEVRQAEINGMNRVVSGTTMYGGGPGSPTPRQWTGRNVSVQSLVIAAFGLRNNDEVVMPRGYDRNKQFDIDARVAEGATREQIPVMLQHLLRERFGLRYHTEPRQRPVFVVTVARGGIKFKESAPARPPAETGPAKPPIGTDADGYPIVTADFQGIRMVGGTGQLRLVAQRYKVADLLRTIENYLGRQVVDETGLTGEYDFRFAFAPRPSVAGQAGDDAVPTIREVLEALGFRIEGAERPVDAVIVDAVNAEPTEN